MPTTLEVPDRIEVTLDGPLDLAEARGIARRFAGDHGGDADSAYYLAMIVNELLTNGLEAHERESIAAAVRLALVWTLDLVRIEVRDLSPAAPVVGGGVTNKEGGRGLGLVQEMCVDWGWEFHGASKLVWTHYKLTTSP